MKPRVFALTALLLVFMSVCLRAIEFVWHGHGTVTFDVPANWTLRGTPAGDSGYNFRGESSAKPAASLQITLVTLAADKPAPTRDGLRDELERMVQRFLADSVEKRFVATALKLRQGFGWFTQLTDGNLVGKPTVPGDFKVMRNGFASLDAHTMAVITMQFDDAGSTAPAEMLHIVESMKLQTAKSDALRIRTVGDFYELSVPQSQLTLKIPIKGLTEDYERSGDSGTGNPRYFYLKGADSGLVVSGWFEPVARYEGLQKFWQGETAVWKRARSPEPINVKFGQLNGWETIEYDLVNPSAANAHLRAELKRAGTWIDLHASITSDRSADELHTQLRAFVGSLVVGSK